MHFQQLTSFLLTSAAVASAKPLASVLQRDDHPVNFKQACEKNQPPKGNCVFIIAGGTTIEWSGTNLGNGEADRVAVVTDSNCKTLAIKEWEPTSPGFHVVFDDPKVPKSGDLHASTSYIGSSGVSEPDWLRLDGSDVPGWDCGERQNELGGFLGVEGGYWKACNFPCTQEAWDNWD
ncbi:hypothetical protein HYQ45_018487 [Verticillium longisporum]|uniref:Uncharacterized protein n=3 Tax=Verticillium TaxID=1036719 RepID=G2WWX3_VERDV|nr:uncharacterized protein VDAG_02752 [Verticillium dahliae VdLs.17]KAF3351214.1 Putative 2-dehydropantoate 2-reductase [Verticillium dahliae VDG2]KAF3356128.1 hypothetical protein VdG1_06530 [Verticillium dahliae VDG1]KAG7105991.1 hypothetical protein HYQ45_018487 [Verticillium longisporum]KAH6707212.1 hypothetical protein EV126DRAFT_411174 [Verticillium dahliae]EGY21228.1 hypothetical protein VDAG_02752 [Verticillium dahliae VdLs.17]